MEESALTPRLQVLVCTYGAAGMQRFASTERPKLAGVEYIVSWQLSQEEADTPVPDSVLCRCDIKIYRSISKGLSLNRNLSIGYATAPLCLISDDDIDYGSGEVLQEVINTFGQCEADVICFKAHCPQAQRKVYPSQPVAVKDVPKGWYATSFEIAFRRNARMQEVKFNENFGIASGTPFQAGEEDIWLFDARRRGASVYVCPIEICRHEGDTTSEREGTSDWFAMTQGAVNSHLHTFSWPLRCLKHALKQKKMPVIKYYRLCVKGAILAIRKGYFR